MKQLAPFLFRRLWLAVLSISVLVVIAKWPNASGEDITHSREFFQQDLRSDFLGSVGTVFYGLIPNGFFTWYHNLLLFQVLLTGVGFLLIFENRDFTQLRVRNVYLLLILYFGILLGAAQTRDGIMLAFSVFGIGLFLVSENVNKTSLRFVISVISWFIVILGFSFRPWLSVSLAFIYLAIRKIRDKNKSIPKFMSMAVIFVLLTSPMIIDQSTKKIWNLQNAYPQQIVMIHDLAATYCWSVNTSSVKHSAEGLSALTTNPEALREICQFFKPNTWQAVSGFTPSALPTKGMIAPIKLIDLNDDSRYQKLQDEWFHVISRDPFTYIQNHLFFGTQVLISGESRNFSVIETAQALLQNSGVEASFNFLVSIFVYPYEIVISLHLLSPLALLIFLIGVYLRNKKLEVQLLRLDSVRYAILAFISWTALTILAFASDNGRYTYQPVFFLYLVTLLEKIKIPNECSKKGRNLNHEE
jgi:hypothetical protein